MVKSKIRENKKTQETTYINNNLDTIFRGLGIGVLVIDKRLKVVAFSPAIKCIFNINEESIGETICVAVCSLQEGLPVDDIKAVQKKRMPLEKEVNTIHNETYIMNVSPFLDENNKIAGVVLSFTNITNRKKEEEKLLLNRNQIAAALDGTKAGWGSWDWRTGEGKWSIAGIKLMDFSPDEDYSTAKGWLNKIHPNDRESVINRIRETIKNKSDFNTDYRIITKEGKIRHINATGKVLYDSTGYALSSTGLIIDRTEQKKAEEHLSFLAEISQDLIYISSIEEMMQTAGEKISRFLNLSNCVFVRLSDSGKEAEIVYSSQQRQAQSLKGTYMLADFLTTEFLRLGRQGKSFIVNDINADKRIHKSTFIKHGIHSYLAVPFVRKQQWQFFICVCHSEVHQWENDEIILVEELTSRIWTVLERKRAEAELRTSEEKFRALFSSIDEAFVICQLIYDEEGKAVDYLVLDVNPAFEKMTGFKTDFVIGKTALEIRPGIDALWIETFTEVVSTGTPVRFQNSIQIINRWYDVFASSIDEAGSGKFTIVFYDITTKKNAELALQQSEERLRLTINAGNIGTCDWDVKSNSVVCNRIRFQMYGLQPQPIAVPGSEFGNRIHPDDAENVMNKIMTEIKTNGRYTTEHRILLQDETVRWIFESGEVIEWDNGEPLRVISILMDITDRKTEEKQKDDFFVIASHELKTPVTSIKAFTEILEELFKEAGDQPSADLMKRLNNQVDRLTSLINHMLDTTKVSEGKLQLHVEELDVAELTKSVVEEMQRATSRNQILTYTTRLPVIKGDKERLRQVITNLLSNAIKYSPQPTDIVVKALLVDGNIQVTVQDFGIGMSSGTLTRLFQRFFRSDNPEVHTYPGLGLGLYISQEIVKRHGGTITVKSEKRKGSTFTMTLPVPQ